MRRQSFFVAIGMALLAACGGDDDATRSEWSSAWGAAPHTRTAPLVVGETTVRQVVRVAIGGERVRVTLSNLFGTEPLVIGSASIARSTGASSIDAESRRMIELDGDATFTIPQGTQATSDAIELEVGALDELAVSLYFTTPSTLASVHDTALRESYLADGDQTRSESIADDVPGFSAPRSWFVLTGLDVESGPTENVVVAIGDSITDGFGAVEVDGSWPERLAQRMNGHASILNSGISGNRLLRAGRPEFGPSVLERFERDVLDQPGATAAVIQIGINDILAPAVPAIFEDDPPSPPVAGADLIAGLREIIARAKSKGLTVIGGTLLPYEQLALFVDGGETARAELNEWIRDSGEFDAVIDFEAATRDPQNPLRIFPDYDSGDTLHPNDAGYQAMADAAFAVIESLASRPAEARTASAVTR